MPQVDKKVRKERAAKLRELGEVLLDKHLRSKVGQKVKVLVENDKIGRVEDFTTVDIWQNGLTVGDIVDMTVREVVLGKMRGEV